MTTVHQSSKLQIKRDDYIWFLNQQTIVLKIESPRNLKFC